MIPERRTFPVPGKVSGFTMAGEFLESRGLRITADIFGVLIGQKNLLAQAGKNP
jgi:hypothetical protein